MKPVIFCLEDFEMHRFVLETHLTRLLEDRAEVRYFRSLAQLKASNSGCHLLIDPIGFGFEHYDALGRYRQFDGDFVVDASGEVLGTDATDTTFDGAPELGAILAASDDVRDCFATQVFRFAVGRGDVEQDACSVTSAASVCRHGECNVRDVLIAVATSDSFRYRRAN